MSFEKLTEEVMAQRAMIESFLKVEHTVLPKAILMGKADAYDDVLRIINELDECGRQECDYFKHYLAYGPSELSHEEFHAAVAKCAYWQEKAQKWYDDHETDDLPKYIEQQCRLWEKKIRA